MLLKNNILHLKYRHLIKVVILNVTFYGFKVLRTSQKKFMVLVNLCVDKDYTWGYDSMYAVWVFALSTANY